MAEIEPETELVEVEPPEHALAERLGAVLRQRRVAMGMRQDELALAAGVGRRFIIDLEAGKPSCQLGKAMLVAEAMGVRIADLVKADVETHKGYQLTVKPARISIAGQEVQLTGPSRGEQDISADPDLPDDLEEPSP